MNNPVEILVKEHVVIVSAINLANQLQKIIVSEPKKFIDLAGKLIDFFRNYADKYHHYKEESFLFPRMCDENQLLEGGIIKEMLNNHEEFRNSLRNIEKALKIGELASVAENFSIYCNSLLDHIAVENEELFQIAETLLKESELENIYFLFLDIDLELGESRKKEFENFALETTLT